MEDQTTSITLLYQFGSYPAKGFEQSEVETPNGLLGGYFYIEIDHYVFDYKCRGKHGIWDREYKGLWFSDHENIKFLSIDIPVTVSQKETLEIMLLDQRDQSERVNNRAGKHYDYPVLFKAKRIIAVYKALSRVGILTYLPKLIIPVLFPRERILRRFLTIKALRNGWIVTYQTGRETRVWESV